VIVVVPTGKGSERGLPSLRLLESVVGVQSVTANDPRFCTTAEHRPASFPTLMFAGKVMIGAMMSTTVTVAMQLLEPPLESVTVKVTLVEPILNGPAGFRLRVIASPSGSDDPLSTS